MFELVYFSTADSGISQGDITNILNESKEFNSKNNVTGCLLYYNGEFLQILEGDKMVVQNLFASIKKDERHFNIMLLNEGYKDQRTFEGWSMAYEDFNSSKWERSQFVRNMIAFSDLTGKSSHAVNLFWTMVKNMLTD
ncbi:MAG: BLUF domain-containing protein [Marinoscillum sp.]